MSDRCTSTCPHGDRCTLPADGHDHHNHGVCPCNEPNRGSMEPTTETTEPTDADILATSGEHIAQFFTFAHLPPHLQEVSRPFAALAAGVVLKLPRNPERTVALRKLLEAKEAAVRALLAKS